MTNTNPPAKKFTFWRFVVIFPNRRPNLNNWVDTTVNWEILKNYRLSSSNNTRGRTGRFSSVHSGRCGEEKAHAPSAELSASRMRLINRVVVRCCYCLVAFLCQDDIRCLVCSLELFGWTVLLLLYANRVLPKVVRNRQNCEFLATEEQRICWNNVPI